MYIKVTVFPDFKKEKIEIVTTQDGPVYKMYIREPAERGQANKRVLEVLQKDYPNKRIRIVSGALSTKKLIEIK